MTPAQTRAKRKTLAKVLKHRALVINGTPRTDQPARWYVVCGDCAHEWRVTNAYNHGTFADRAAALDFAAVHNVIDRFVTKRKSA